MHFNINTDKYKYKYILNSTSANLRYHITNKVGFAWKLTLKEGTIQVFLI